MDCSVETLVGLYDDKTTTSKVARAIKSFVLYKFGLTLGKRGSAAALLVRPQTEPEDLSQPQPPRLVPP
jgi:hypothetical protein